MGIDFHFHMFPHAVCSTKQLKTKEQIIWSQEQIIWDIIDQGLELFGKNNLLFAMRHFNTWKSPGEAGF